MKRLDLFFGAAALFAVVMTALPADAQENGNKDQYGNVVRGPYETNRFGDNWFLGAGGGVNVLLNEDSKVSVGPNVDAGFGKWFTPAVGMRVGYSGFGARIWNDEPAMPGAVRDDDQNLYLQKLGYMYVHGDFLWNMSNALGGYKETRFWNFVPYLHAGYFRSYGLDGADFADNEIAAGAGLLHNLRLSNRIDLIVDMKAIMVNGRVCASEELAILPSVTMGLAVDLGWPSFVRTSSVIAAVETANLVQIEALEAAAVALELANEALVNENEQLSSMNDNLNKEVAALKNHPKYDASDFFKGMTPAAVYFDIGKAVLDEKQLCNLDFLAKNIIAKADKNAKIIMTVMGSADSNTGSEGRNKALSEARGKYVFDILTGKYGISKSRLTVKSEVVKADDKPELSRAVMISF